MNVKTLVISLAAAATLGLAANAPQTVSADWYPAFGNVTTFEDHGFICCAAPAAEAGGAATYVSPSSQPAQAAPGQWVHPYFGAVDSFVDQGFISPTTAFGDREVSAVGFGSYENLGTVQTAAVTGPIEVGGITYIPCSDCGGAAASAYGSLGTVETMAVTGPIEAGNISYIPVS